MTKTEITKYKKILEARAIELEKATWRRDAIKIEVSAESLERRLLATDREFAVRALELESVKLRETRAALNRIEDGDYGICQECDEDISQRRLAALPWAALCIRCQEANDCGCGAKHEWPVLALAA